MTRRIDPLARRALAALFSLVMVQSAIAAESELKPAFGNTIVSTHPDGRQAKLWLNRDRTYAAQGRKGQASSGVWKVKGKKLCLSQRKPISLPLSYCKAVPPVALGGQWSDIAVTGERVKNRLVRGK